MSKFLLLILSLATLLGCTSLPGIDHPAFAETKMTFSNFECAGDWPLDEPRETTVVRSDEGDTTSFHVRHSATCGLDARRPAYAFVDGQVKLKYDLYSKSGAVVMCDCDYRSRFSFKHLPEIVKSVSFEYTTDER